MQPDPAPSRRPRRRRLLIASAVLAGGAAAWTVWSLYAANSFAGRVAAIRAAGDPGSLADLAPEPLPEEHNAAAPLVAVAPRVKAFAREHGQLLGSPLGQRYEQARGRGEPAPPEALAAIGSIVVRYEDIGEAVAQAAARERYASPQNYNVTHAQFIAAGIRPPIDFRSIARLVNWRMETAIADGRPADALQDGIELLRLARHARSEPGFLGGMLANAVYGSALQACHEALAAGVVPEELHDALERELAQDDDLQSLVDMLKTERALVITAMQEQFGGVQGLFMNTAGRFMKLHHTAALDLFDAVLPEVVKPWHETAAKMPANIIFQRSSGLGMMADMLQPSIEPAYESANRTLAVARCLRVDNALRRYAARHGGEARGLDDLDLPRSATVDPFSGEPLKLQKTDAGWVIYSIGKNGVDDGGSFDDATDVGLRPRKPSQ